MQLPAAVDVRPEMLDALRQVNDRFDVYHLADGRVWLLWYEPNAPRVREARKGYAMAHDADFTDLPLCSEALAMAGFALWGEYDFAHGTSVGYMVAQAQQKVRASAKEIEQAHQSAREQVDGTEQRRTMVKVLSDRIRSSAMGDWKRSWRGRKVFARNH